MNNDFTMSYFHFIIWAAGFGAMVTQLVLLRELMSVFEGNEMVLGIALGNWMLLMGLGAWLGCWKKLQNLSAIFYAQILQAILPWITVFALRALRHVFFLRGSTIGIWETLFGCFFILFPFCLSAGCFLVLASNRAKNKESIGRIYTWDNFGGVIGGIVFTFLLVQYVHHFAALSFVALFNLMGAFLVARAKRKKSHLFFGGILTLALFFLFTQINLETLSTRLEYPGETIVFRGSSSYGDLLVTETAGQYNFLQNGVPLFSSYNIESREEAVHFAMAQKPDAHKVLILGGGVTGTAKEVLMYPVQRIDAVEINSLVVQATQKFLSENISDPRISIIQQDGRWFLKNTSQRYDVILVGAPEPTTFQFNRFYTKEFFREAKQTLQRDGIFSFALGNYENYLSPELTRSLAIARRTLQSVFKNVLILPGNQTRFLASDGELTLDIAQKLESQNISTQWVNQHALRAIWTPQRLATLRNLPADVEINSDFNPVLYFHHLRYWLSRFKTTYSFLAVPLMIVLGIYLVRLSPVSLAIFTTGFSAAAIELSLIAGFQIIYGSLYHRIGAIIAIFMLGITMGSFWMTRALQEKDHRHLQCFIALLALYACLLPWILTMLKNSRHEWMIFFFPVLIPALLTGMIFPLAAKCSSENVSMLYRADYLGACLGFLLVNTLLLPLLGFLPLCLLTAAFGCFGIWRLRRA
ncbi:MAG: hypothetical protein ACOY3I_02200 [Verrucomicrobiota bacterium]